jgi:hypothetical protein
MGFIGKIVHDAKHVIADASRNTKNVVHDISHASKNAIHKSRRFISSIDSTMLSVQDFAHSIPYLKQMMSKPIPQLGNMSIDQIINSAHGALTSANDTFEILEAGFGEVDNILEDNPKLQREASKFKDRWISARGDLREISKQYQQSGDIKRYEKQLMKYKPLMKQAKQIASQIVKKSKQ